MENKLYPEDVIIVNKIKYGPQLPRSPFEIPWLNLFFYMNDNARKRMHKEWWNYERLGGVRDIKQGDIFVFTYEQFRDVFIVKRCVGLPGDTLKIHNGDININNRLFKSPKTVKNSYSFKIRKRNRYLKIIDSLQLFSAIDFDYKKLNYGSGSFSKKEIELLKQLNCIDSVKRRIDQKDPQKEILGITNSNWTLDNLGPVIIPKKNMIIQLNPTNLLLYKKALMLFEKIDINTQDGHYTINGKIVNSYKFQQNYYFMAGDNRKEALDSRSWGFLPESNIVGKAEYVLYSNYNDIFQWDRLFKAL